MLRSASTSRWFYASRKFQRLGKFFIAVMFSSLICYGVLKFSTDSTFESYVGENDNTTEEKLPCKSEMSRALNIYTWRGVCGVDIRNLKQYLFFPRYPDESVIKFVSDFQIEDNSVDYGKQIFGFVQPPESGLYRFAIASDDESELWFSLSEDPSEKQLIARVFKEGESAWTEKNELNKYPKQISEHFTLADKKYYIEVFLKQGVALGFVQVYWKRSTEKNFRIISSEYLSPHSGNVMVTRTKDVFHNVLSGRYHQDLELKSKLTDHDYLQFYSLPLILNDNYLPSCDFNATRRDSLSNTSKVHRYQGLKMVHVSRIYPADSSSMDWPNQVADRDTIQTAVDGIITSLSLRTSM